jgi:type IV pilus assembly protein PilC
MKYEEFAFFNQQLSAMVRDGIPLEGALRRLCAEMRGGRLRTELVQLGEDLGKGVPLREALQNRQLPDFYRQMLEVGAQANDLPAVLTLLADYYQRRQVIWTRLKGLMVYPAIVLCGAFVLSCFLSVLLSTLINSTFFQWPYFQSIETSHALVVIWCPPFLVGLAALLCVVAVTVPGVRRLVRWRLPAFKEASLAQVASALALMLRSGVPLDKALGLAEKLEQGTPAAIEIAHWRQRLGEGRGKFSDMAAGGQVFPPLFVWMVGQSGEALPAGFERAAEIYQARASYRAEVLLYSALPCSVIVLGMVIVSQIQPVLGTLIAFMNMLGDTGSSPR